MGILVYTYILPLLQYAKVACLHIMSHIVVLTAVLRGRPRIDMTKRTGVKLIRN